MRRFWGIAAALILAGVLIVGVVSARPTTQERRPSWEYMFFTFNINDFELSAIMQTDEETVEVNEFLDVIEKANATRDTPIVYTVRALNYLGDKGWEVIATETVNDTRFWTLKRPAN
jgi:hypothetical protein